MRWQLKKYKDTLQQSTVHYYNIILIPMTRSKKSAIIIYKACSDINKLTTTHINVSNGISLHSNKEATHTRLR